MVLKSYWKFVVAFAAILGIAASGYFIWDRYFSEAGLVRRQAASAEKAEKEYIAAMTADTYGGKTPQETLDLFVAALRAGDVELASKYFLLDENLSREKWADALQNLKKKNLMQDLIKRLQNAVPDPTDSVSESDFRYVLLNNDGLAEATMRFRFNDFSKVWKIENL
mgnify:CR=1 FL=1